MPTRGIRLNNPGNIEHGQPWLGLSTDQPDSRFCQFDKPEYGIRAISKIIRNYHSKYGLTTIEEIISRWAPPQENPTQEYINNVAVKAGKDAEASIDFSDSNVMLGIIKGIITQENGSQPYADDLILSGINMA